LLVVVFEIALVNLVKGAMSCVAHDYMRLTWQNGNINLPRMRNCFYLTNVASHISCAADGFSPRCEKPKEGDLIQRGLQ
jgi:hypothetical protein